ncbi:hypothetical protein AG1IA_02671 [Rhizoctonia solani AG-1 IA]|uniref:Uncharacterized protein n=1 Tax=Thanatephorus cucumeris (strain AG1-IA) TaxID=983506 RepID=L8X3V7_THACA|nr:hypothetical protein AG1IA_02671 [Rhizoctonia solani AG-1 IA]
MGRLCYWIIHSFAREPSLRYSLNFRTRGMDSAILGCKLHLALTTDDSQTPPPFKFGSQDAVSGCCCCKAQ